MAEATSYVDTNKTERSTVTVSVVSHGHGDLIAPLVRTLLRDPSVSEVILTLNTFESVDIPENERVRRIQNEAPQGFAANHNQAFTYCKTPYFCVLNPDIFLSKNIFSELVSHLVDCDAAIAAPTVISPAGNTEDSWRDFPTFTNLIAKACGNDTSIHKPVVAAVVDYPDWVAGMCLLFGRDAYQQLGGFDEGFFLYYEDVDICVRAWKAGLRVIGCRDVQVTHDARRASRTSLRHMRWHLSSMGRYFFKYLWRLPHKKQSQAAKEP